MRRWLIVNRATGKAEQLVRDVKHNRRTLEGEALVVAVLGEPAAKTHDAAEWHGGTEVLEAPRVWIIDGRAHLEPPAIAPDPDIEKLKEPTS